MNNKHLVLILIILTLCLPLKTFASILTDIPDQMLAGIEEWLSPYFTLLMKVFFLFVVGYTSLWWTLGNLTDIMTRQVDLFENMKPIVMNSWQFTSGLSNMILIVIFIAIAFAFIFKIETFQAKKSLPRLIIVALLINFSFLFVQMFVDVFQIIYNTFLPGIASFGETVQIFTGSAESQISEFISFFSGTALLMAAPYVNAVFQSIVLNLFPVVFLPLLITMSVQGFLFLTLAGMFLIFLLLFIARPFILGILVVFSPLAFICLILPQTKKYWDQWLKFLLEWLILGVIFLFLLNLAFSTLKIYALPVAYPFVGLIKLPQITLHYVLIVAYLGAVLLISKSTLPQGAQLMIDSAKGLAGTAMTKGLKVMKKPLKDTGERMSETIAKSQTLQDRGKSLALSQKKGPIGSVSRWAGRKLTSDTSKNVKDQVSEHEKQAEKMDDLKLASYLKGYVSSALTGRTSLTRPIGYLNEAVKRGKIDKVCKDANISENNLRSIFQEADKLNIGKTIMEARPDLIAGEDKRKEFIAGMRPDKIKNMSSAALNDSVVKIIMENWDGRQIGALFNQLGRTVVEAIDKGTNQGIVSNQQLQRYFNSQAGQAAGFSAFIKEAESSPIITKNIEEEFKKKRSV